MTIMTKDIDPHERTQDLSSVNPQYENVPAPPQSVLSMKECAAYGVVNMHSNIN